MFRLSLHHPETEKKVGVCSAAAPVQRYKRSCIIGTPAWGSQGIFLFLTINAHALLLRLMKLVI